MEAKGQYGVSSAITHCLMFLRQDLSPNLNLANSTRLAGPKSLGSSRLCFPSVLRFPAFPMGAEVLN